MKTIIIELTEKEIETAKQAVKEYNLRHDLAVRGSRMNKQAIEECIERLHLSGKVLEKLNPRPSVEKN